MEEVEEDGILVVVDIRLWEEVSTRHLEEAATHHLEEAASLWDMLEDEKRDLNFQFVEVNMEACCNNSVQPN